MDEGALLWARTYTSVAPFATGHTGRVIVTGGQVDTMREFNRHRILDALRSASVASRADLSRATGLSRNTVASIVAELQRDGVVRESNRPDSRHPGRGRPAALLALAPVSGLAIVVDVGHTHVRVGAGDASGTMAEERVRDLPEGTAPAEALAVAADLVTDVTSATDAIVGAVLGLPAPVDTWGRPAVRRFEELDPVTRAGLAGLGGPVLVRNDGDLGALGEAHFGAGRGVDDFVFVKVSHGLGAGLVLGRRLYRGSRGLAGDLGHVRVREDGDVCLCGNRGCLETLVSTAALVAALQPAHPGRRLTVADLFALVREQDAGALVLVTDAGRTIGRTLAGVVNVLNPAAIVVGGQLSALGEPLVTGIRESIERYSQRIARADLRVVPGECGDRAVVLGGLALALGLAH
jgi:predicted NBD/HSP70 family sugar kinase